MSRPDLSVLDAVLRAFRQGMPEEIKGAMRPGVFRLKLVEGGPWVGAKITHEPTRDPETGELLDRSPFWSALIHDEPDDEAGPAQTSRCWFVWSRGEPVPEVEYRFLISDVDWHVRHNFMTTRAPVDLRKLPPIEPPR